MSDSVTPEDCVNPQLADTIAEADGEHPRGMEHARVKSAVRSALFGRVSQPVRIGRFTVLRKLGSGGMGVVYSAFDDDLDRKVAIKVLRPDDASSPARRTRLRREAQAIARLSHPNVVPIFDVGEHDGQVFLAMEFVRGATLREWLEDQERDERAIRDVLLQAARGLQAAHDAGIVHRDFKPDNVMVGADGRVRVLDFGVAALALADEFGGTDTGPSGDAISTRPDGLTLEGSVVGTPAYMAPEALRGETADAKSDQFSYCVTVWEALHGERPFGGDSLKARLHAIESGPPAGETVSPNMPAAVAPALRVGLAMLPEDRFASMAALIAELEHDPAAGRRRAYVALGGAVVAASLGFAAYGLSRPDDCATSARSIDAVWGPERRATTEQALAAAQPPIALGVWNETATAMDAYAAAWTLAHEDGCETSDADGSEETALSSRLCLQWALDDLREIADGLATGKSSDAASASHRVGKLFAPARCLDPRAVAELADERARRAAPPPPGSEDGLICDFESGLEVRYGAGWATSTDEIVGGHSKVSMSVAPQGANQSKGALRIEGVIAQSETPNWAGAMLFTGEAPFAPSNLQSKHKFWFRARGTPGPRIVMLFTSRTGFSPALAPFEVTETWQRFEFDLSELEADRFDVTGVFVGSASGEKFDLLVDDVHFD